MLDHVSVVPTVLAYSIELLDTAFSQQGKRVSPRRETQSPKGTPASTIEALLYELRAGLSCLADPGARNRLRCCDEAAIGTISSELLTWKEQRKLWLPPWSKEDVAKLLTIWRGLK
jgi:hypothetical protein